MQGRKQLLWVVSVQAVLACGAGYAQGTVPALPPPAMPEVSLPAVGSGEFGQMPPLPAVEVEKKQSGASVPPSALPLLPDIAVKKPDSVGMPASSTLPTSSNPMPPPSESAAGAALAVPKDFSFGQSSLSILFLPNQMERMKSSIRTYESTNKEAKPSTLVAPEPVVGKVGTKINEPDLYPVFYLASIAYDRPGDWSIWISGYKITSRKNETDVSILHVAPDSVTFLWKPDYGAAILRRKQDEVFAPTVSVKHKLALSQPIKVGEAGEVTFTLRPNQSFSVGYLSVFEGYVDSPKLQSVMAEDGNIDITALTKGAPPQGGSPSPQNPPPNQAPDVQRPPTVRSSPPVPPPVNQMQQPITD